MQCRWMCLVTDTRLEVLVVKMSTNPHFCRDCKPRIDALDMKSMVILHNLSSDVMVSFFEHLGLDIIAQYRTLRLCPVTLKYDFVKYHCDYNGPEKFLESLLYPYLYGISFPWGGKHALGTLDVESLVVS